MGIFVRLACAWVMMVACVALAQQREPLRSTTNLVNLSFTARDTTGALVGGMKRDEVQVSEDGVPQKVAFFSQASDLPLTLGLVVDASGSQDHFTKQHQHDLEVFLKEVLRPQDKVFLVCFGNHIRLASDFTSSPQAVLEGMKDFKKDKERDRMPEIGPNEARDLGTAFYDAIFYPVTEKMAGKEGRRALLVFSDGEDNSSSHQMLETIEAAQAENVLVYTIRYTETKHGRLTARNKYGISVMERVAKETGAASVDAGSTDAKVYFHAIAEELRNSYELAYYPTNEAKDETFRKIAIKPVREGVVVRTRTGYLSK
jgi:Ca-activated chloride channel family protein